MQLSQPTPAPCCAEGNRTAAAGLILQPGINGRLQFPLAPQQSCRGADAAPAPAGPEQKPGYELCSFVAGFLDTAAGPIPRIKTGLDRSDHLGTVLARVGVNRARYRIAPGLYAVGKPDPEAPVLVTANYKLTFDALRRELGGMNAWLLVLDTRGVNVWCSAGKGILNAAEIVRRIRSSRLDQVVRRREIIVPQLAANGVCAREVKKASGFRVIWGPIRARDLKAFIQAGHRADPAMRRVTFDLRERLVLIPVEIYLLKKPTLWVLAALFVLSGLGSSIFSFSAAMERGWMAALACALGVCSGAVAVPALLPWIPGRAFAVKGALAGIPAALLVSLICWSRIGLGGHLALWLWTLTVSSVLAMNFTGATPFTSPSGVEKEMRRAIPLQIGAAVLAAVCWIGSNLTG